MEGEKIGTNLTNGAFEEVVNFQAQFHGDGVGVGIVIYNLIWL